VSLVSKRDSVVDFRLVRAGRISGIVWLDLNENGRLDEGEEPLTDVRVVTGSGRDTLTDANGNFMIGDLPPGEHVVLVDEKTLPDRTTSVRGSLSIKVLVGSETGDVVFPVAALPPEVKRFPGN
jgi:SdrD B-like protein